MRDDIPSGEMTLRDYFAANAPEVPSWYYMGPSSTFGGGGMASLIRGRWEYADAMMRSRTP